MDLPIECQEHIFEFVPSYEEYPLALVCKEWYLILKRKRQSRNQPKWVTWYGCVATSISRIDWAIEYKWLSLRNEILPLLLAEKGDLQMLQIMSARGLLFNIAMSEKAARHGHLHILKYIHSVNDIFISSATPTCAAERGHLEILQWCQKHHVLHSRDIVLQTACRHGHLHVMIWIHEIIGCSLPSFLTEFAGTFEVLKWCIEKGLEWSAEACICVMGRGNIEEVQWCLDNGCALFPTVPIVLAMNHNLTALKLCYAYGWSLCKETCAHAANHCNCTFPCKILEFCYEQGCAWDPSTCSALAGNGNLKQLQWCREKGCPWNENTCSSAALRNHEDVLKWCHEQECPWDARTCQHIAMNGNLALLKWCRERGCPWNINALDAAFTWRRDDVVTWCIQQGLDLLT